MLMYDLGVIHINYFLVMLMYVVFFLDFVMKCSFCQQYFSGPQCASCKKFAFHCSICRLPVKGKMQLNSLFSFFIVVL